MKVICANDESPGTAWQEYQAKVASRQQIYRTKDDESKDTAHEA